MKKIAIVFNEKNDMFEAYWYSIRFRIFGPSCFGYITSWNSEDGLIKRVKEVIYGKLKFIRVVYEDNL